MPHGLKKIFFKKNVGTKYMRMISLGIKTSSYPHIIQGKG